MHSQSKAIARPSIPSHLMRRAGIRTDDRPQSWAQHGGRTPNGPTVVCQHSTVLWNLAGTSLHPELSSMT